MELDDLKLEVRAGFSSFEKKAADLAMAVEKKAADLALVARSDHESLEQLVRADHDLLIRLNEQFMDGFVTTRQRVDDHEKRLRFLERIAFAMIAIVFIVSKIWK